MSGRINQRVAAAIDRASRRYFAPVEFVAANGRTAKISAVKKIIPDAALAVDGAAPVSRRAEFIVSTETFAEMERVNGGSVDLKERPTGAPGETSGRKERPTGAPGETSGKAPKTKKLDAKALRGAKLVERVAMGAVEWRFDQSVPFDENSPEGGSVRLFAYRKETTARSEPDWRLALAAPMGKRPAPVGR